MEQYKSNNLLCQQTRGREEVTLLSNGVSRNFAKIML